MKTVLIVIGTIIVLFGAVYMLNSKFHSGDCIKSADGYIWQINDYRLGEYRAMGWQDSGWGNSVEINKAVLERKNEGVSEYHEVTCPEFNP